MSKYKLLLFGISGDLAIRKILPSLGQLIEQDLLNQYELIGYSRSIVEPLKIQEAIASKQASKLSSKLCQITLKNGEYNDPKIFYDSIKGLEENERLFVYLALPPVAFFESIQNFCPYSKYPVNIILEKPYSTSLEESQKLMQLINICDLQIKIHFFDHYLFKSGLELSEKTKSTIRTKSIKTVYISALEHLGLEKRAGYYDSTGAVKDMLPHLLSLWENYSIQLGYKNSQDIDNYEIKEVSYEQYPEYQIELGKKSSTETYFKIKIYDSLNNLNLIFESGKKKPIKETIIRFIDSNQEIISVIDLHSEIKKETNESNQNEHIEMLKNLENNIFTRFLKPTSVIWQWEIIRKIKEFSKINHQNDVF